jgi:hypothetical protein
MTSLSIVENRDVLSHLLPKMTDEALNTLYLSDVGRLYRGDFNRILTSDDFWRERSSYLVGRELEQKNADWKAIYYILKNVTREKWLREKYKKALGNLDALMILESMYGKIKITKDNYIDLLSLTSDVRVFDYLVSQAGTLTYDIWTVLAAQLSRDNREIVNRLLLLVPASKGQQYEILEPLIEATEHDNVDAFEILLEKYKPDDDRAEDRLESAIRHNSMGVYQYMLERYPSLNDPDKLLDMTIEVNNVNLFKSLFESMNVSKTRREQLLNEAVTENASDIVMYLSALLDVDWMNVATLATRSSSPDVLKYALTQIASDVDIYPLLEAIDAPHRRDTTSWYLDFRNTIYVLFNDDRIRTEELSPTMIQRLYNKLDSYGVSPLYRYREATGSFLSASDIIGTDTYSLLLRELVLAHPSKRKLIDWMLRVNSKDIRMAVASVLDKNIAYSDSIAPIRALMISLLYPTLSNLDEQLEYLKEEGYSKQALIKSAGLLSLIDY